MISLLVDEQKRMFSRLTNKFIRTGILALSVDCQTDVL